MPEPTDLAKPQIYRPKGVFLRYRTRLSQILGVAFFLVFMFSEKKLASGAPLAAGCMFAAGCVLVGVAMVGRLWCAQYISGYKKTNLVTYGPYSVCRNPLYVFSLFGGAGAGLCTESVTLTLVIVAVFALIYPVTIAKEERDLRRNFGDEYDKYAAAVPRFIPKPSIFFEPAEYTIKPCVLRRMVVDTVYFIWIIGLFELVETLTELKKLPVFLSLY
jgi:protein-S-isoprenylcysteine O-methyltransferase Ste14